jgi:hypothetical protein
MHVGVVVHRHAVPGPPCRRQLALCQHNQRWQDVTRRSSHQTPQAQKGGCSSYQQPQEDASNPSSNPEPHAGADGSPRSPAQDRAILGAWPLTKCSVQLAALQVVCGYGVTPVLATVAEAAGAPPALSPLLSQLLFAWAANLIMSSALVSNRTPPASALWYSTPLIILPAAVVATGAALAIGLQISSLGGGAQPSSSAAELRVLLGDGHSWTAVVAAGAATAMVTPWVEERVWRGILLQGLLPFVGAPAAVRPLQSHVECSNVSCRHLFSLPAWPICLRCGHSMAGMHTAASSPPVVVEASAQSWDYRMLLFSCFRFQHGVSKGSNKSLSPVG